MPRVILIHGFPEPGESIKEQLKAIRELCNSLNSELDEFIWATDNREEQGMLIGRLVKPGESLVDFLSDVYSSWYEKHIKRLPPETKYIVISYSAGGALFYRWVEKVRYRHHISCIASALTIAAPIDIPTQIIFHFRKRPVRVRDEPEMDAEKIISKLRAGKVRLKVVFGEDDETIPEEYASFSKSLDVDQELIRFADHISIRSDKTVRAIVRTLIVRQFEEDAWAN